MNIKTRIIKKILLICVIIIPGCSGSCVKTHSAYPLLIDFEADADLDRLHWECRTLFSLSDNHATHGKKSLYVEFYPSDLPQFAPVLETTDWSAFTAVCFDVYNPAEEEFFIAVRIDDRNDFPDYYNSYHQRITLKPGLNHIRIPFNTFFTVGMHRPLDIHTIYRFALYKFHPQRKYAFYIDYVRLT